MKLLQKGAEADIYLEKEKIIKVRNKKNYRLPEIDNKLRKSRTKSEVKIINKLQNIISVPKILSSDNLEKIEMEFIEGKKLSENLENLNWKNISEEIGKTLAKIHDQNIIHGDLTTSNMIYKNKKIYLIDFGLGFHSNKIEDKAVDLHLLKQSLNAKHFSIFPEVFNIIINNYKAKKSELIIKRIEVIEKRGRYRF
ncbi:MAG: KEOPS complex kinase/ATPase Bud32 [Nanoarchaeota archaeon]